MRTPKHTPGPWEVTGPHSREVITTNPGTYKPCMTVAKVGGYWDGEAQANAHLIAAAPAMYEALTDAERMWNIARMIDSKHHAGNPISNDLWSDFHQYLMEWHTKRKDALAQAEREL